jgi:Bacterial SH3 domain
LRYAAVSVFERADLDAPVIERLGQDDPLVILGSEGEFYRLQLTDGRRGFVFAHNIEGKHLPLTAGLQRTADERAARDARRPTGWRGMVQRFWGTR